MLPGVKGILITQVFRHIESNTYRIARFLLLGGDD
jgi:hypothetical protein